MEFVNLDYQFVILACGIATVIFTIIMLFAGIKLEMTSLRRAVNEMSASLNIAMDKSEAKRDNDIKDLNLRVEAIYSKLDNLLWRFLNKQQ